MKEKRVTYELTVAMPESYNLEWAWHIFSKAIEKADKDISISGFYLLKEETTGEII
jgi:hypothetical protein